MAPRSSLLVIPLLCGLFAAPAPAQDGEVEACVLTMAPQDVPIGKGFLTCVVAPPNSSIFLLISPSLGTIPSPYGMLDVGLPLMAIFPFEMGTKDALCFPHRLECAAPVVGMSAHFQFVAVNDRGSCVSNLVTLTGVDGDCAPPETSIYSFTIGGWGQNCGQSSESSPGCFRDLNFDAVFPGGLVLGDQDGVDGDDAYALVLTTSQAVADLLPNGGPSAPLTEDATDPTESDAGNVISQLAAAKLNVAFDDAGLFDELKLDPAVLIGDLVYADCVPDALLGMSVREVIEATDLAVSGAVAPPAGTDLDDLGTALDILNNGGETPCLVVP